MKPVKDASATFAQEVGVLRRVRIKTGVTVVNRQHGGGPLLHQQAEGVVDCRF
jgi:hypothetical protein